MTHLRSVASFLKPLVQLGRQPLAEQGQVGRSKRVLALVLMLALLLVLALVSMPTLKVTPKLMSLPMLVPKLASKLALALEHSEAPAGLFEGPQQLEAEALAAHRLRA